MCRWGMLACFMATAVCGVRSPGQIYHRGMQGFFYGNGGMRGAGAWRLHKTYKTYAMMMGASCDTPGVCGAAVWFGSVVDLPQG